MHKPAQIIILLFCNFAYCQDETAVKFNFSEDDRSQIQIPSVKVPSNSQYFFDQDDTESTFSCQCKNGRPADFCQNLNTLNQTNKYENCHSCNKGYHLVEYQVDLSQEDRLLRSLLTTDELEKVLDLNLTPEVAKAKHNQKNPESISSIIKILEERIKKYDPKILAIDNSSKNEKYSICLKNWCRCKNGHQARGELCREHGSYHCAACHRNFQLINETCHEIIWSQTATMVTFWLAIMVPFVVSILIMMSFIHFINRRKKRKRLQLEQKLTY